MAETSSTQNRGSEGRYNRHGLRDLDLFRVALSQMCSISQAEQERTQARIREAHDDPHCHPRTLAMIQRIELEERKVNLMAINTALAVERSEWEREAAEEAEEPTATDEHGLPLDPGFPPEVEAKLAEARQILAAAEGLKASPAAPSSPPEETSPPVDVAPPAPSPASGESSEAVPKRHEEPERGTYSRGMAAHVERRQSGFLD